MRVLLGLVALQLAGGGAHEPSVYHWTTVPSGSKDVPALLDTALGASAFTTPRFAETADVAAGDFAPDAIVRVGRGWGAEANLGFSLDGGRNWRPPISLPKGASAGRIAVSSTGRTWVWSFGEAAFRTEDYGAVWTVCEGLPPGLAVVADRTGPNRFYAVDAAAGKLYVSEDGARVFEERELGFTVPGGTWELRPTPGRSGDLWLVTSAGLYHAEPGRSFAKVPSVESVRLLGFGKAVAPRSEAVLLLVGTVGGQKGLFLSQDGAAAWNRIDGNDLPLDETTVVTGDPKGAGLVYVVTHKGALFIGHPGREGRNVGDL